MFPIILAHGIARFDILRQNLADELDIEPNQFDDKLQYFRNVRTFLEENGFAHIKNTNVDFSGSVIKRAEQLKKQINALLAETEAQKVHIIAHSMGGLDARLMIAELEMAEKVQSLTTIGTLHHGTVLADLALSQSQMFTLQDLEKVVKTDLDGFGDLTTSACRLFNEKLNDSEAKNDVFYQTYASFEDVGRMFVPLILSWGIIRFLANEDNDGLVPFSSQQWDEQLVADDGTTKNIVQHAFPFQADHLNQTGWWDSRETILFGENWKQQRNIFESKIKNIYLNIANDLQNRFG